MVEIRKLGKYMLQMLKSWEKFSEVLVKRNISDCTKSAELKIVDLLEPRK